MENVLELKIGKEEIEEINKGIVPGKKVDEGVVESSLDYNKLTIEEQQAIDEFTQKIDINDTNAILTFGSPAQTKISEFSDNVLKNVKTKDTGVVGNLLVDLTTEIKSFDGSVPTQIKPTLFNSLKKQINKLIAKYSKVETNVAAIEKKLESHKLQMMKDIALFDEMYETNLEYFKNLSLYIIAGQKKLEELKNVTLKELQAKAEETREQTDIQAVNDMNNIINRFEKKLYDLKLTRMISIQMAPQIRLIQNSDAELVDKIQSSIINTIPLWKNQMVIALGLTNAQNALEAQRQVSELTNKMLEKNSELLKEGSIKIAEESEKGIIELETLKKTNQDLIETLTTVLQIQKDGHEKRMAAEVDLQKIEEELKNKLLELKA